MDKRFFLNHLEVKPESMSALIAAGSIDAKEGDGSGAPPGTHFTCFRGTKTYKKKKEKDGSGAPPGTHFACFYWYENV